MAELTILITTYNRWAKLKKMLESISVQGCYNEYNLIISDNHSDYDVKEFVLNEFEETFTNNILFNSWSFNTGQSTNMSISFLLAKTKWYWYLSDDDEIVDGSLKKVFDDIKIHNNACAIRYSIQNSYPHSDTFLYDIADYINYYHDSKRKGEMIYLSMVYNLDVLKPFLSDITMHSYTYISFLLPMLQCLVNKKGKVFLSSYSAYKYNVNIEEGWSSNLYSYFKVLLGIRTFYDIDFNIPPKQHIRLINTVCFLLTANQVVENLLRIDNNVKRDYFYHMLKPYWVGSFVQKKVYSFIYQTYRIFGVNLIELKHKIL